MRHPNLDLIDRFFEAYGKHDLNSLQQVLASHVKWTSLGQHPLSGVKNGIDEVIAFFDAMGTVMGESSTQVEKLVMGANDEYVIECQRVWTNRVDGHNLDHMVCVLWKFDNGRIVEGRHFFADPQAADGFFNDVLALK